MIFMNFLDYIIIIGMIYLIVKGIMLGFIREICSLAGVVLGIFLGNLLQPWVTGLLRPSLPSVEFLSLISFGLIFAVILILFNLIGWIISLSAKKIFLGWLDRTLGVFLAIVKGVIITYLVIVILTFYIFPGEPLMAESKLSPWVIRSYQNMIKVISPDSYQNLKKKIIGERKKTGEIKSGKDKDIAQRHE
jgi:membrane protein required for colicin V production